MKHGFKLFTSLVRSILDSKSALAFAGITTAGILAGEPFLTTASALSGAVIEIGKISLEIASKLKEVELFKENNELAYIFEARERLTSQKRALNRTTP